MNMTKAHIIAFTEKGGLLAGKIQSMLNQNGWIATAYCFSKYAGLSSLTPVHNLKKWCADVWGQTDAILFIGATGIAVRTIAPFIQNKTIDPAVVVMDEQARFSISLLSGHIGGANTLAAWLAEHTGAVPVLTTATDVNRKFAVDVFAKKNHLAITSMPMAKEISAAILHNMSIGFFTTLPIDGNIPDCLTIDKQQSLNIIIGYETQYTQSLLLIPQEITLGIGCKKDTSATQIERSVFDVLMRYHLPFSAVESVSSIDIKRNEKGLVDFCEKHKLPYHTYSAETLAGVPGQFSTSDFVKETVGVDCVCERAAVYTAGGHLVIPKVALDGVTVAAAKKEMRLRFE
jgi:cobalt-precorrin 5A hydrolase